MPAILQSQLQQHQLQQQWELWMTILDLLLSFLVASAQSALDKITTVWIKMEIESRRFKYLKYVYVHIFQCASLISLFLSIISQLFSQSIISQSTSQLVNQSVSRLAISYLFC